MPTHKTGDTPNPNKDSDNGAESAKQKTLESPADVTEARFNDLDQRTESIARLSEELQQEINKMEPHETADCLIKFLRKYYNGVDKKQFSIEEIKKQNIMLESILDAFAYQLKYSEGFGYKNYRNKSAIKQCLVDWGKGVISLLYTEYSKDDATGQEKEREIPMTIKDANADILVDFIKEFGHGTGENGEKLGCRYILFPNGEKICGCAAKYK